MSTHVELRAAVRLCDVQSDLLDADEVLAAREALGERERHAGDVLSGERNGAATIGHGGDLVDFEPDAAGAVPVLDVGAGGRLCEVDVDDTGVVRVVVRPVAELRASSDVDRLGGSLRLRRVAAEVGARHVGNLERDDVSV